MNEINNLPKNIILPPRLKKGDIIGVVAPAGPILNEDDFIAGVRLLREMGFEVKFADTIRRKNNYLAGSDEERAAEFEELWADSETKAIIAVRGGYGCLRILPLLNMDIFRTHPKIFVGFSDITVLLSSIFKETGLITFHGPMLTTLPKSDREAIHSFLNIFTAQEILEIKYSNLEILVNGSAKGRLVGGNLAVLTHLLGTRHDFSWQNCILFLEDLNEAPYRIDRMLTHLKEAGKLQNLSGIILGSFIDCGDSELIWGRVLNLVEKNIPVWANFPVGHGEKNHTLPIGMEAEMDGNSGRLKILEPCIA